MSSSRQALLPSLGLRVLIAGLCAPFWISGIGKLLDLNATSRLMLGIGMSHPDLVALAVVLVQLGGSLMAVFASGAAAATGSLALAAFTVAATWVVHEFWTFHGPQRFAEMNIFFEHVSIIFGLLLAAWAQFKSSATSVSPRREERELADGPTARNEATY